MAANDDRGILFNKPGIIVTQINISKPCMIVEVLVFACAFILAELLTITLVIGKPPIKPEAILPIPCANNSRLGEVALFSGSILSTASRHNKVSIEATAAMVK